MLLASSSPRRHTLLQMLVDFEVAKADVEETSPSGLEPAARIEHIARKKAIAPRTEDWVLGADTAIVHHDLMGKPADVDEARIMLAQLAHEEHRVITGVALARAGDFLESIHVESFVTLALEPADVDAYLATGQWVGKAGSYGLQDPMIAAHATIEGPWSNVVGLPLEATKELLERHGIACRTPPSEVDLLHHNPFDAAAKS